MILSNFLSRQKHDSCNPHDKYYNIGKSEQEKYYSTDMISDKIHWSKITRSTWYR